MHIQLFFIIFFIFLCFLFFLFFYIFYFIFHVFFVFSFFFCLLSDELFFQFLFKLSLTFLRLSFQSLHVAWQQQWYQGHHQQEEALKVLKALRALGPWVTPANLAKLEEWCQGHHQQGRPFGPLRPFWHLGPWCPEQPLPITGRFVNLAKYTKICLGDFHFGWGATPSPAALRRF